LKLFLVDCCREDTEVVMDAKLAETTVYLNRWSLGFVNGSGVCIVI
jgi:hypothetical protein